MKLKTLRSFWWACIKWSFNGAYGLICGVASPIIAVIVFIILCFIPLSDTSLISERNLPILVLGSAFAVLFLRSLVIAPFKIYYREQSKADALEDKLRPKLEISLGDPNGTDQCTWVSNETMGGFRIHHAQLAYANALCIVVKNTSTMRIGPCVGLLTEVQRLEDGNWKSIGPAEPVALPWHTTSPEEHLTKVIEPMTTAQLWLASINYNGFTWLIRDLTKLHGNQQSIFGAAGTYRAQIQINDGISDPSLVEVELTSEPDQHKHHMHPGIVHSKLTKHHMPQA